MKQVINFFTWIGLLSLFFFACCNIIIAISQRIDADEYKSDVIAEIESSNFNDAVIDYCKTQAAQNGYTLTVTGCQYDADNNIQMAEVILEYKYAMPVFNITSTKLVRGTAR